MISSTTQLPRSRWNVSYQMKNLLSFSVENLKQRVYCCRSLLSLARKPESQFIGGVHKYLVRSVYRMKNHNAYVGGIPDCWYSASGRDLWVEYKYIPVKRPRLPVIPDLSELQIRWIRDRKEEGRNIWVIVGCKAGGVIYYDFNEMLAGVSPDVFMSRIKSRKELANIIYNYCTKPSNVI